MLETNNTLDTHEKGRNYFAWFAVVCLIILLITYGYYEVVNHWLSSLDEKSTHGDMYGGLNTIFTGLAFAGVLVTIIMQQEELRKTSRELAKTATAQQQSKTALTDQLASMLRTTEIEALNSYINSHASGGPDSEMIKAAKRVIKNLTEEYIRSDVNKNSVDPKLNVSEIRTHKTTSFTGVDLTILNRGCDAFVTVKLPEGGQIYVASKAVNNNFNLPNNKSVQIRIPTDNDQVEIDIDYTSNLTDRKYKGTISISKEVTTWTGKISAIIRQ